MEDVDSLDGRLLDAAVARYLFGFEVEERTGARSGRKEILCRQPGMQWVLCTYYAASVGASLNVEYELGKRGWTWRQEERARSRWSQPGVGRVILEHKDGRLVEAEGANLQQALCRAAVKAVAT